MFVNRQTEFAHLDSALANIHRGTAQLVMLYGRRRIGKTTLLRHWAETTNASVIYWAADKEPPALQRRSFTAVATQMPESYAPQFDNWDALWEWFSAQLLEAGGPQIIILDEVSYASEADYSIITAIQRSWEAYLQHSQVMLILAGSHVKTMESLAASKSPLHELLDLQMQLPPLKYAEMRTFFPDWSSAERIILYSMMGGIPAYLSWLDPSCSLDQNLEEHIFSNGSMFIAEPQMLLYDELRELNTYLSILRAIANGQHTLTEISNACLISRTNLTVYLARLLDMQLIDRRLPVTIPDALRPRSKRGRYHLTDAYFRFYFRFIVSQQQAGYQLSALLQRARQELDQFASVGFERVVREWIISQTDTSILPFVADNVGAHWSRLTRVDVVAVHWAKKELLLAACHWEVHEVPLQQVKQLVRKASRVRPDLPNGAEWKIHFALFSRSGLSPEAAEAFRRENGVVVPLERLDQP
ncbi:MAG: ATP-binding protein [Candidatus Promineifilaceae bacterium]